jgi:hypothetical protein
MGPGANDVGNSVIISPGFDAIARIEETLSATLVHSRKPLS